MIIQEPYKENEKLVRTFSDEGKMIIQNETGIVYSEAIDVSPCRYTYTETDQDVEELPV